MVAFYACLYYAALRPEEAAGIIVPGNLVLPPSDDEWGEFLLDTAEPHAGKMWTDGGANRDRRQLKQRAVGDVRPVPCPPVLTAIIRAHIARFGLGPGGRLFVGERNKQELPILTINRIWRQARAAVFTPEVYASPLAESPYDLRHAAVSTQLNAGISPTQVAEWAGQSPEVLWRNYAKCLAERRSKASRRASFALPGRACPVQTERPTGRTVWTGQARSGGLRCATGCRRDPGIPEPPGSVGGAPAAGGPLPLGPEALPARGTSRAARGRTGQSPLTKISESVINVPATPRKAMAAIRPRRAKAAYCGWSRQAGSQAGAMSAGICPIGSTARKAMPTKPANHNTMRVSWEDNARAANSARQSSAVGRYPRRRRGGRIRSATPKRVLMPARAKIHRAHTGTGWRSMTLPASTVRR